MKENSEASDQPYKCQCNKCGKFFISTDIQVVKYQEYSDASFVEDYTSPCCNAYFDEVDDQDQEYYKCKKCGNIFLLSSDLQVVNYQELCPDTVLPEHLCPRCNTRHVFLRDILARSRDIDQVESGPSSIRDNITRLVLIKKDKGLLPSTIHPPRRPAATHRSMAGLQSVSPEVVGL